ncbi:hypothetical protein EW146_g421 [Bondarzewia mesenterica]|uniref:Sterol regulatory element-binding protein cleavage-activating protein n=1 Tax=Bondarzewia mesenterica TaxID=1095465 RepID=A0A4S4M750_9AGAM|nr:hypothetical protein EW146_g421 [Bondarzewia mesenterica]
MDMSGNSLMQRTRTLGHRFFHRFGIHCATHQIRVILISAVVITSLFYPALAIYSASQPRFLAQFSSQILDPFLAISSYQAQHDLWNVWMGHDKLHVREDSVARARCGVGQTLRVERVLVHGSRAEEAGALSHQTLLSTLNLEHRIAQQLSARRLPCLRKPDGKCLVISPLEFWEHDENLLMNNQDVLSTLSVSKNVSIAGAPIVPQMVLAGREMDEYSTTKINFAMFLVLTYFFRETDCLGNSGHFSWLEILQSSAKAHADLMTKAQEPKLIALEVSHVLTLGEIHGSQKFLTPEYQYKTHPSSPRISILTSFLYFAYFVFVVLFMKSLRNGLPVHDRIGLILTGVVELLVSTITSLSVCALGGFKVTMVPWEIFPLVVIFIGSENMFRLVEAVVKTSITLPVKERIAEGLSRAGTSNTLKVLTYNIILGVIAFFSQGAIRQFCAFAVVVLVAHWFLVHTFFIAVLSIDLQRLELEELLQQNASLAPTASVPESKPTKGQPKTFWTKVVAAFRGMLQGRATKNISLVVLLATAAILYFATYPAVRTKEEQRSSTARTSTLTRSNSTAMDTSHMDTPAWHTWRMLSTAEDLLVHLRLESPTVLMFYPADSDQDADPQSRPPLTYHYRLTHSRIMRTLTWMFRIVVLPITVTVTLLYGLLLYLLKDAERLEAQRNRAEPDLKEKEEGDAVEDIISFMTLPRALSTDVELIAASKDGSVIATVGLENEIVLWNSEKQSHTSIDATNVLLSSASTSSAASAITALAVNDTGSYCAVGTGAGVVALWAIGNGFVRTLPYLILQSTSSAVVDLQFFNTISSGTVTPSRMGSLVPPEAPVILAASYENGVIAKWNANSQNPHIIAPSYPGLVISSSLLRLPNTDRLIAAFSMDDGTVHLSELTSLSNLVLCSDCRIQAGNPVDLVARVCASYVESGGTRHLIIGAATQAGVVSLWDGATGECISILDDVYGQINNLRVCPVYCKPCPHCGELPMDSFTVSFSIGHNVVFYRVYMSTEARRCSCTHNQPQVQPSWNTGRGRRSRSTSFASSSNGLGPSRSRHSSISDGQVLDTAAYPISGHGVLKRRTSEKDFRRHLDTLLVTFDGDESEMAVGPLDIPSSGCTSQSKLKDLIVVRAADTTFERGSWDVVDDRIVGVRRKPRVTGNRGATGRLHLHQDSANGLSALALERWEVWTFDPSTARFQVSPLAALERRALDRDRSSSAEIPVASRASSRRPSSASDRSSGARETVPRLPFTRVSPFVSGYSFCLAGFGNTVGLLSVAPCRDLERTLSMRLASKLSRKEQM